MKIVERFTNRREAIFWLLCFSLAVLLVLTLARRLFGA